MLGEDLLDEGGAKGVNGDVPRLELNRERLELPHIEDDEDPGWEIVLRRWRGIAHLENNLSWAPFPLRLAFVRPTEVLNYDEEFLSRIESFGEVGLDSLPNPCLTEEDVEDVKTVVGSEQPDRMHQLLQKRKMQFSQTQPPKKPRTDSSSLLDQGLSNFIKIRGIVEKTPERQSKPVKKAAPIPALPRPETDITPFPTPALANASRDMQIVVSTSIAAQRSTMRQLKTLLPGLDVIERDSIIDADITISPSTGLIMTTLAKIKQRSLPGQAARQVSIRERIAAIALRYEKLVILVEGSSSMDEHDCMAWGDFLGYTAILDAAVQVTHVASEPVNWMATYILLHSTADLGVTLLPEETMWERFLRAGGLNSWAAQYALARLKDQPRPGLAAFALPVAECMQRLVDVVGKRVLRHSVGAMTSSSACTATTATGP
ncbi:hypothetical protein K470DRAFT_19681 [Piedraia hortae CBS 480.64]|uniref:Uncharacterized protein n=1 Tax=Piedraia hortae CBS 480.64 TaxID=1314780 RepID=A0A6A7BQQ6_9PEZI|nr:hypothetical protein K470DRAFT_19681 [Piedraia hortae CBS 480.64]